VNLDVISWLGVWYVKSELYEKAIEFFERASEIQPNEVWPAVMHVSCVVATLHAITVARAVDCSVCHWRSCRRLWCAR
jgi:uncharacterized protein HemY